jgi:hypothetical protein
MDLIWSKNEKVAGADEIRLTSACVDKNGTAFISYINTHKKDKKEFYNNRKAKRGNSEP